MDFNNIRSTRPIENTEMRSTHTSVPKWLGRTMTEPSASQSSGRKFYTMLAGWIVVLSVAVAASISSASDGVSSDKRKYKTEGTVFTPHHSEGNMESAAREAVQHPQLTLINEPANSMPSFFRECQTNEICQPELLQPVAYILAEGKRPLRVLQIGDSHVAGRSFPLALKETLTHCLGEAENSEDGKGVYFSYIGRNGATSERFMTARYMNEFAVKRPDLIILSLGTNEAHGLGYREDRHERQLDAFFARLHKACPDATVLLTTPPGDYLASSYVNYRRTSRSRRKVRQVRYTRRPNPMSARCAAFITDYGRGHHMPVWDLFNICGGEGVAQRNWSGNHYMRSDRIHFEPEGYQVQGHLLGEAIVGALIADSSV